MSSRTEAGQARLDAGPERVVLRARPGATESAKPPVRIFVGTEPSQYRAERVLLWSIEQARDPGRIYEIHLMRQLPGFWNLFWNTGFTNYRFAVPHFAGSRGRAIYVDVDQIFLADPGELFDLDLGRHSYLSLTESETSVMLLDCERMARIWTLDAAQRRRKYGLIRRSLSAPGAYGRLPAEWNARDEEYEPGRSKLLHYTTIHKQPWRPFPERFVYQPNPHGKLWFDLEKSADAAGFNVHGPHCPSSRFRAEKIGTTRRRPTAELDAAVDELVDRTGAGSLLELGPPDARPTERDGVVVERVELSAILAKPEATRRDGVVCTAGLEDVPVEDAPWVVDALFRNASRFVFAAVRCAPRRPRRRYARSPQGFVGQPKWWTRLFEAAAARHPDVRFELALSRSGRFEGSGVFYRTGGSFPGDEPRIWVITDFKPGHTTQSVGLAEELGWPYERIDLEFGRLAELPNSLLGSSLFGLTPACARSLAPPWPDLVIAAGRRTAPVASWIRDRSRGRTRTVQLGRMGVFRHDRFDRAVLPIHARLFPDPRYIETIAPITQVTRAVLAKASTDWKHLLDLGPSPRIALLVGGTDPAHEFTVPAARELGGKVAAMAREAGGSVFVTTSRRTSEECADALEAALGDTVVHFHRFGEETDDNPFLGYLALADVLVTTGESASMIAEACATGKPVAIQPLPRMGQGAKGRMWRRVQAVADVIDARARARPTNRRGFERPQQGLELVSAKLLSSGLVRPNQNVELLHQALVERGAASMFDGRIPPKPPAPYCERARVANEIRALLGCPVPAARRDD